LGAYTFWNDFVYAEIAAYRSAPQGLDQGGTYEDIQGFAPYWRVALQHTWEDGSSAELGAYGLQIQDYPSTALPQGPVDQYTDAAVDAQVQWIGDDNLVTAHSTFIHEDQALGTTFANAGSANLYNRINTFRADATYFYRRTLGLTAGYFATDGTTDAVQYPGSANGSPMTNGLVYEFNYVPAQNTKLMLQYRTYLNYAGASGNYDGLGRNAFDNDTLMLMAWLGY